MNRFSRVNALCAGIALAMAGSSFAAEQERVLVKFQPGSRGNVENAVRGAGGQVHHRFDELGFIAISVPAQALNGLRNNPNVVEIEPDGEVYPMGQTVPYGIPMVQAPQAWTAGGDGTGILVCVVDSGINAAHEDLAANVTGGYPSNWNSDTCGHGTHVAGSVGALNNGLGVVGVAPNAAFYIVRVFSGGTDGCAWSYSSTVLEAAQRCAAEGDRVGKRVVVNMSLGGSTSSTAIRDGFQALHDTGRVLSIAAAGNDGNTTLSYPASYPAVMSVAAIDSNKALASFSQRNAQVEIAAPGVGILSTMPFSDASASVAGASYMVAALTGTFAGSATAALVDGGQCTAANSAWSGKVVLCERGTVSFADKNTHVQNSGGRATIIYNNVAGSFSGTLNGAASSIPGVTMSQEDGQFLKANQLGQSATVSTLYQNPANAYGMMDGTSMASPHAAGAAAAIWSSKPTATNAQVRAAMTSTAEDLGTAGRDNSFGYGLVRTANAITALAGSGGGSEPPPANTSSVGSVAVSFTSKGKNLQAKAAVSVQSGGAPLAGATVNGCFSGAVSGCGTGTTGSTGQVTFSSGSFTTRSNVQFCVSSVAKTGYTFQPGASDCGNATP